MSNPILTWRLRRTGRTSWSSLRDGSRSQWLAEHVRRREPSTPAHGRGDGPLHRTWLAPLRLDERVD